MNRTSKLTLILGLLMTTQDCFGATVTTNFNVTAKVTESCEVNTTGLDFGNYASLQTTHKDVDATINVRCNTGNIYTVVLNSGSSLPMSFNPRKMNNLLEYNLYTDAARTTVFGDGSNATVTVTGTGNGIFQDINVYGRIFASQDKPAGNYADTVLVTVDF